MFSKVFNLPDEKSTIDLGRKLAHMAKTRDTFALYGTLGMGKSVLSRAFIQELTAVKEVPSPTFTLVQSYDAPDFTIYHFDLYRLEEPEELEDIDYYGITEGDGVSLVEWGDKFEEAAPDDCLVLDFKVSEDGTRIIEAHATGERARELSDGLF